MYLPRPLYSPSPNPPAFPIQYHHAMSTVYMYERVSSSNTTTPSNTTSLCYWPRPAQGHCAVNCDVSYQPSKKMGGLGVIIRDEVGRIIMCKANRHRETETIVLRLEMTTIPARTPIGKTIANA